MKKIFTFFVFALCAVCAWAEDTEPKVVDDVYQISTASELTWFASHVNAGNTSANAVLTADIVVNANVLTDHVLNSGEFTQWSPIGTDNHPYHGTFDGQGHTVSGLFNDQGNSLTGFFGHIGNATIKNLGVTDTYFKCYAKSGGIAGFCARSDQYFVFTIENCWFDGLIVNGGSGYNDIGGILGGTWSDASDFSRIINCYNLGTISVGYCYSVGGIIGYDEEPNVIVENCYNIGNISGKSNVGSIAGEYCYLINNCYYLEGTATADGKAKGGIGDGRDSEGEVEAATAEQFASGEICYKLNGDQSSIAFGQILGSGLPSLTSDAVVYRRHTGCTTYTNNPAEATDEERMHNLIVVAEIPVVSGVSHGAVAHYKCSVCNATFADADGKTPLNSESLCLHDFVDGECSVCHQYDSNVIYEIATLDDLYTFAEKVNNGWTTLNAVLTADIVVNENVLTDHVLNSGEFTQWSPIGTYDYPYHGTFDGQGHTVSGLFNNQEKSLTGFFGHIGNATIKNLGVTDTYFKSKEKTGGIAGFCASDDQVFVFAIENCWFDGLIVNGGSDNNDIGGILGGTWSNASALSRIINCYNLGTISVGYCNNVGGIIGYDEEPNVIVENCYNIGNISGGSNVGSIAGEYCYSINNCYYLEGTATADGKAMGGIGDDSDSESEVEAATAEQFASGEICYKLNGDQSAIAFGQILGSGLPSLTSDAVVYRRHTGCSTYTNNPAEATDEERKHNIILVAEIPAVSGVSHGVVTHYKCSVCNALFADADGKTPLNSESLCLHDFVDGLCSVCHQYDSKFIYEIATLDDLYTFAEKVNNGWTTLNAVLTADIVVNENVLTDHALNSGEFTQWSPIGTYDCPYHGTFDGQGHTVSGLFNDQENGLTGFFGHIGNATIKNLGVTDTYFKCYEMSGGIAGFCASDNQYFVFAIENCWFDGRIDAADYDIGGILGGSWSNEEGRITNCYNLGTISSTTSSDACVGGITGYCSGNTTISNCFNYGEISGNGNTGSILGQSGAQVENCYYLEGSALNFSEVSGGIGEYSDSEGVVEAATAEQFASGEICYKLNGDQSKIVYHQNLDGSVVAPNFTSKDVVILDGENYVNAPSIPTAVKNINADKREKAIKTIEDGKIVIIKNGEKYDLAGRKL